MRGLEKNEGERQVEGTVAQPATGEVTLAASLFRVAANLEDALLTGKEVHAEIAGAPGQEPGPKELRPKTFLEFGGYLVKLSDEVLAAVQTTRHNLGNILDPKE